MSKFEDYKKHYFRILEKLESAIDSGRWDGMSLEIDKPEYESDSEVKKIYGKYFCLYFCMIESDESCSFVLHNFDSSPLDESGDELFDMLTNNLDVNSIETPEDAERALFAYIDAEYQSKRYLTGIDYEHYELNPDLEVDEYGVIYNTRSKTIVKCLNENLETYWVKDGTKHIIDGVFANNKYLKTIVLPETILSLGSGVLQGCNNLRKVVLLGQTYLFGWPFVDAPWCILYLQNDELDIYKKHKNTRILDKEKIKRGIIAAANSGFTYRDLLAYLQEMSDVELNEPVCIISSGKQMDGLVGIRNKVEEPIPFSEYIKQIKSRQQNNCKYKDEHERIKRDTLPDTILEVKEHWAHFSNEMDNQDDMASDRFSIK